MPDLLLAHCLRDGMLHTSYLSISIFLCSDVPEEALLYLAFILAIKTCKPGSTLFQALFHSIQVLYSPAYSRITISCPLPTVIFFPDKQRTQKYSPKEVKLAISGSKNSRPINTPTTSARGLAAGQTEEKSQAWVHMFKCRNTAAMSTAWIRCRLHFYLPPAHTMASFVMIPRLFSMHVRKRSPTPLLIYQLTLWLWRKNMKNKVCTMG